jgi:hypothetical protein
MIILGIGGLVIPYRFNPFSLRLIFKTLLSESANKKVPKVVGTVSLILGVLMLLVNIAAVSMRGTIDNFIRDDIARRKAISKSIESYIMPETEFDGITKIEKGTIQPSTKGTTLEKPGSNGVASLVYWLSPQENEDAIDINIMVFNSEENALRAYLETKKVFKRHKKSEEITEDAFSSDMTLVFRKDHVLIKMVQIGNGNSLHAFAKTYADWLRW